MSRSRRSAPAAPTVGPPALASSRLDVANRLRERIERGREILGRQINTNNDLEKAINDLAKWRDYNFDLLKNLFTNEIMYEEYRISCFPSRAAHNEIEGFRIQLEAGSRQVSKLESIAERLELFAEPDSTSPTISVTADAP